MRTPTRSIAALGAVFFASISLAACGGGISGNAVVDIKGTSITKSTFAHWMTIAAASTSATTTKAAKVVLPEPPAYTKCIAHLKETEPAPAKGQKRKTEAELKKECAEQYKAYKTEVLGFLISSQWVIGQAEEMKISASNKEVEKVLAGLVKQQFHKKSEYTKYLESSRQTASDLLLRIKVRNVLAPKIEKKVVSSNKKPTKADIAKYYSEHESTYGAPESRNLNIVLTKTESQAKKAKSEIEGGKSFARVAKAVSIESVSKSKGGVLEGVQKGQQQKALSEAVFSAKRKVLTGPIKTPFGFYVFEVKKVVAAVHKPLSSVEAQVKQTIISQDQTKALQKFGKEYKKRWQARTECRAGYVVEDCKGYKAPKATTTPPPTTTTTTPPSSSTSK
ncbi:MAG: peptidyl-prolyl cis-trans isomerase [Solirubrobacteraceae bacterium]